MRILFVTPMFPNSRNIQQGIFVWELARALQAEGMDVRVASIEPILVWPLRLFNRYRRKVAVADVPEYSPLIRHEVKQLPRNTGLFLMYKSWAKALADKMKSAWPGWFPQVVHSHTLIPGALIADELFKKHPLPHLSTSHGADTHFHIYRKQPRNAIIRMLSKGIRVAGVGQPIVEELSPFVRNPNQIQCIANGMDMSKLLPAGPALRQKFSGRKVILAMGNLIKTKGFDLMLKAFSDLAGEFPLWDVVIVGGGTESVALTKLVDQLDLCSRIHFIGPVPRLQAMEWMDLCDIFCLPSWAEGFGVVYLEAMACSKPVIGVAGQGIDAVIREHSTGLLTEPKSVQSIIDALRKFMVDESLRKEMGERGRKVVLEKFTWASCAQKYMQLYREMMDNN